MTPELLHRARLDNALWVAATMQGNWPAPDPDRRRIGMGSLVHVLQVVHEEPAVLIVDEWGHLQWVTIDSVRVP